MDILKHELVPKHEIMKEQEVKELLEQYKIQPYHLPWIKSSDPVIQQIGAKPGNVIKITRESQTAGKAIVYKYVVEG